MLYDHILANPVFADRPPVLIDIGAGACLNPKWRPIARHSVCLAFDADKRDFEYVEGVGKDYQKLLVYPCICAVEDSPSLPFVLTNNPLCSSTLEPDREALADWSFADKFAVAAHIAVRAVSLPTAMHEQGLTYVDAFKTDSQGTDLRLFQSLDPTMAAKIIWAEFEPGIIDAYQGEDKLHDLLRHMDRQDFWVCDLILRGSHRINRAALTTGSSNFTEKDLTYVLKEAPGWAEISFLNTFAAATMDKRSYLLGWIFADLERQHGFAAWLAQRGAEQFGEPLFQRLGNLSLAKMHPSTPRKLRRRVAEYLRRLARKIDPLG